MFTKESQPGIRVLFWIGAAILLMLMDHKNLLLNSLRSKSVLPLTYIDYIVSWPIHQFQTISINIKTHNSLLKENQKLKTQQLLMKAQMQRLQAIETENNQLKALMHSAAEMQGKVLIAKLLAVDSDPFSNQVLLDKGTQDGVYIGQPVLDANGVMGKIIEANSMTSRVLLINDSHSGISIQINRTGARAIAMGDSYSNKLHLVNVPQTVDVQVGDTLVTSGLGDQFPAGYPVGQVKSVKHIPGLQFATIEVHPSAAPDKSRQVLLVWPNQKIM